MRSDIAFTGIKDHVQNGQLEETVESVLPNIDVNKDLNDTEDCHRVGKSDSKTKLKKKNIVKVL